jgi:nucleoside-diphosphate-sugar epimerase
MYRKRVFIGCDESPVTLTELVNACKEYGGYEGNVSFVGPPGPVGKVITGKASQEELGWKPKYESFVSFMKSTGGKDWYTTEAPVMVS